MGYTAVITRVSTGETRRCHFPDREWDPPGADWTNGEEKEAFVWEDGNDSCDCNRANYFARAAGQPDVENQPCAGNEYRLDRIETDDGRIIERESAS